MALKDVAQFPEGQDKRRLRWVGVGCLFMFLVSAWASLPVSAERPRYAAQLERECDQLMAVAIVRPYGCAWAEIGPVMKPRAGGQVVTLDTPGTAGAGFVLYWSGELLDRPAYKKAAFDAARGMAASRMATGQIPARANFLPGAPGGHDAASLVADRAASRAAVALILSLLEDTGGKDDQLQRMALPTLAWLLKQQTSSGGWPQASPPTAAPAEAVRMMRLDLPDYRDSVYAMLLAADVLNDTRAKLSVDHAVTNLLRMRIGSGSDTAGPLWATAYGMDDIPTDRLTDYQPGIDMLASRNAMQTLQAGYLVRGDPSVPAPVAIEGANRSPQFLPSQASDTIDAKADKSWSRALADAVATVNRLPRYDGRWIRKYEYEVRSTQPPPSTQPALFSTTAPVIPPSQQAGTWGLDTLIEDAQNLADAGREKYAIALNANSTIHQRLAAAACGLDDDPLSPDLPVLDEEVASFLKSHAAQFQTLDGPMPATLGERVRRIYLLLIRAKLERRMAAIQKKPAH